MIAIDSDSDPDYTNNRLPKFFDLLLKYPEKIGWAPVENASDGSKAIDVGIAVKATAPTFFEKRNAVITGGGHNLIRPIIIGLKCICDKATIVCLQCAHPAQRAIIG